MIIHCIGDSHSAVFSGEDKMQPCWPEQAANLIPYFKSYRIGAATAYQINNKRPIIEAVLNNANLQSNDKIMFCFGEVDNRNHLIKQSILQNRNIEDIVNECVERYIVALEYYKKYNLPIIIWGPIASCYDCIPQVGSIEERNYTTKLFNEKVELKCKEVGFEFVTVFYDMLNSDFTTNKYFLDDWPDSLMHLSQRSMDTILQKFKDKNLI